jgi:hypothetical protein
VPQIKTGAVNDTPNAPVLASNEVLLYIVTVAAGATRIRTADMIDVRDVILCLREINTEVAGDRVNIANLTKRLTKLEILVDQPIDLSQIFGEIKTLGQILADLQRQVVAARDVPEIRYDRPKVSNIDPAFSKIVATGHTAAGVPYVDIEVGGRVNFGDAEVTILPAALRATLCGTSI